MLFRIYIVSRFIFVIEWARRRYLKLDIKKCILSLLFQLSLTDFFSLKDFCWKEFYLFFRPRKTLRRAYFIGFFKHKKSCFEIKVIFFENRTFSAYFAKVLFASNCVPWNSCIFNNAKIQMVHVWLNKSIYIRREIICIYDSIMDEHCIVNNGDDHNKALQRQHSL